MTVLAVPLVHPARGTLPVVLSVPHSGRDYPAALIAAATGGRAALESLEDPLVDRLVWRALGRGLGAVIARAPRAAIDCNRAETELDPAVISGAPRERLSARARGGLGLVPARTGRHGYLWRRPVTRAELEQRLDSAHRPYHGALEQLVAQTLETFGCALVLDCHSMPPADGVPPVVIGDGFERGAARWLSEEAVAIAGTHGFAARRNDPFAGGHVVERHGRPQAGVHALQLEIDRSAYLDGALAAPGPGFDRAARLIDALAQGLGQALLDRRYAAAAE